MVGQLNGRVLLVDDDPLVRRLISQYLVAAGYVVRIAVDGLDALAELRAALPDLIISDLNMPRMSGSELLKVVRKRFPQIRVIVMSAVAADDMPEGVIADAYYHKNGFGFEQLLQTISDLTRKSPVRTALPHVNNKPVPAIRDGDGRYRLACPDCMRSTTLPRDPGFTPGEHVATCGHCYGVIQLLIDAEDSSQGAAA